MQTLPRRWPLAVLRHAQGSILDLQQGAQSHECACIMAAVRCTHSGRERMDPGSGWNSTAYRLSGNGESNVLRVSRATYEESSGAQPHV
jgi:hypothetical protein